MSQRKRKCTHRSSHHFTHDDDSRTLHVGVMKSKFPHYITSSLLQQHFSEFEDDIEKAIIIRDPETKESKGYGLVIFTSHEAADNAMIALKGTKLHGKFPLFMRFDNKPGSLKSDCVPRGSCVPRNSCELFFRAMKSKLPNYIKKGHIREHFTEFETDIVSVVVVCDRETKQSKGFGFIKFISHQVAMDAQKKLHGSMLQGKFQLYVGIPKPSASSTSESASVHVANDDRQMPYIGTFQLQPEVVKIDGLLASFNMIGSENHTSIVKQGRRTIIRGYRLENVKQSKKEVSDFVERNHDTITKSIQVSCGCVKFLQVKHVSYLQELGRQCEILIPPVPVSGESISITIQGKKANTEDVIGKLKNLLSKCHVETFEMLYPKNCARLWKIHWDHLSSEIAKQPNILIDFATTKTAATEAGKNTVTALIVGTNQAAIQDLKDKVLKDESCSHVTVQRLKLSNEEFETVSCNLNQLELKLEQDHSTVITLERHGKIVELQVPSSLETNIDSAKLEVMKCISHDPSSTNVTQHLIHFDDIVVGMLLTTKPQYFEEIQKEASQRSVGVYIQKKPKPSFQLRGSCRDVETIEQKICSLIKVAERSVDQTQIEVGMVTYRLLSSDAFSNHQEELLQKMFVSATYPPQQGLLRQRLLRTSVGHMISLQLCVDEIATEVVDAIIIDLNQAESLQDPLFRQKLREYVQKNGTPKIGSVTCHESGSLPCRNVIVVHIPNWKHGTLESVELLFSPFEESFVCSDSKGFGVISFLLSGITEKVSIDVSIPLLLYMLEQFCSLHPKMSIHTIRIMVNSDTSAACTYIFDKQVADMKLSKCDYVRPVQSSTQKSSLSSPSLQWQWRDDRREFTSYPPDISAKLTETKNSNPSGKCTIKVNGKSYVVDLSTMKQTNVDTGFTRDIQHVCCAASPNVLGAESNRSTQSRTSVKWYYMDDQNVLTPYTKADSDVIGRMYNGISKEPTHIVINQRRYTFDFIKMRQINSLTHHGRSIQRRISAAPGPTCSKKKTEEESTSLSPENQKLVITFRGPKENIPNAKRMVKTKLTELCFTTTVPLPQAASNQLQQKLHTIIRKHPVDYRIKEDSTVKGSSPHKPCRVLEIEGSEHDVRKAVTEVQAEIIHFHSESPSVAGAAIKYPQEWVPQTKTTEVFELPRYSDEKHTIAIKLRETLPNARIISVHRIQNKWLWEKYEQSRRRMYDKNAGRVNEKQLFHGSRKTSAEMIYDSEEGFDMRFSSQGMWGQANYFAADAQYSDSYAYVKTDGNKELFLARVLTGDSYTSQSDQTLRMPPAKPTTSHSDSKVQLKQLRYDTVNGVTNDTKVFMTYSNDKAYPAYLIVYSTTATTSAPLQPQSRSGLSATSVTATQVPPQPRSGTSPKQCCIS